MRDKEKILRSAEKYVVDRKFSAAIREYRKLLKLEPEEPTLLNIVGDLLVREGKPQEAHKYFQQVVDLFMKRGFTPKAVAMLKKIVCVAPEDMRARESLADLYLSQGLHFDAVREYRNLIDHYTGQEDLDRALHYLRKLSKVAPEDPEIHLERAGLLGLQEKKDASLRAYLEALQCYRAQRDFTGFQDVLPKVLAADPGNEETLQLLLEFGESAQLKKLVRDLLAKHLERGAPSFPVKKYLARMEEQLKNPDRAARLYKDLRQEGHSDRDIQEGLLRTDPESAYTDTATLDLSDQSEPSSLDDSAEGKIDWSSDTPISDPSGSLDSQDDSIEATAAGSGLFADFEAEAGEYDSAEPVEPAEPTDSDQAEGLFEPIEPVEATPEDAAFSFDTSDDAPATEAEDETAEMAVVLEEDDEEDDDFTPVSSLEEALQEVDFYLKLGFKDDAAGLLKRLLRQFPDDEDVLSRARKVGLEIAAKPASKASGEQTEISETGEGDESEGVLIGPDLFSDFEDEMEHALDDLFVSGGNGDSEGRVLRYDISRSSTEEPDSPKVHYDLGLAYKEMGLVDDALQEFLTAIEMLEGDSSAPQRILCCSMLTNTCRQLGKNEEAIHWAKEGLKIDELRDFERRSFEYDLGLALGEKGELEEAITVLQSIHEKDESYRDVDERLGHFKSRLHG